MEQPLLVVESERKAQCLKEYFAGEINTMAIRFLPLRIMIAGMGGIDKRGLPSFTFNESPAEKATLDAILEYDGGDICLAFDSDQRGEYWSFLLSEYIMAVSHGSRIPKRLYLSGISREEVKDSCRLLAPVHHEAPFACHIRSLFYLQLVKHLQRLLGTKTGPANLPLTYENVTTLFLLEEREEAIRTHKPVLKWQVRLRLKNDLGQELGARLEEAYGVTDDGFFLSPEQVKESINRFRPHPIRLIRKEEGEFFVNSPIPHRLAELCVDAYAQSGVHLGKTVETVRTLYHGVKLQDKWVGLISSPVAVPGGTVAAIVERLRHYIRNRHGEDFLRGKDEALEFLKGDDASGVILPLHPEITAEDLAGVCDEEEREIYRLIRGRALASQMNMCSGQTIDYELGAGGEFLFKGRVRLVTDQGFLLEYHSYADTDLASPCPMEKVDVGATFEVAQIKPEQTSGFSPEYYTIETIFVDLADFAVAIDPSTIMMLHNLIEAGYIILTPQGAIQLLANAGKVIATMNRTFPSMAGVNLPAYISQTAEEAIGRRKSLDFALKQADQALFMHGKTLVKVSLAGKLPEMLRQQRRGSSHVIKATTSPGVPPLSVVASVDAAVTSLPGLPSASRIVEPGDAVARADIIGEGLGGETPLLPVKCSGEGEVGVEELQEALEDDTTLANMSEAERGTPSFFERSEKGEDLPIREQAASSLTQEKERGQFEERLQPEAPLVFQEQVLPSSEVDSQGRVSEAAPVTDVTKTSGEKKQCPVCGKLMVLKDDRYGKYWSCSGFPSCRHAETFELGKEPRMRCPLCGAGEVAKKLTPTGKPFFVCIDKSCAFMAWAQPHAEPCPVCDSPFLVEKKDLGGNMYLRCPRAGCTFMLPLPGNEEAETPVSAEQVSGGKRLVRVRRVAGAAGSGGTRKVRIVKRK